VISLASSPRGIGLRVEFKGVEVRRRVRAKEKEELVVISQASSTTEGKS
jgi:hypothetical protein